MPFVNTNGIRMHYQENQAHGLPIVFLHGGISTGNYWRNQLSGLPAAYRVIAPDLRGFGESDKPKSSYDLRTYLDDIQGFFDTIGIDRLVLGGVSMGAMLTLAYALRRPNSLRALILVGATALLRRSALTYDERIDTDGWDTVARKLISSRFSPNTPVEMVEWGYAELLKTPAFVRKEVVKLLSTYDVRNELRQLTLPTLIITGGADTVTPSEDSAYLHRHLPNTTWEVFPSAGHFPALEQPERFNTVVTKWLASLRLTG